MSFFRSRWIDAPAGVAERDHAELAPGFRAGGVACGIKHESTTDLGIVACEDPGSVSSAVLLTRNASAAAPIRVCREELDAGAVAACIVNSGNANASTGEPGYRDALAMRESAAAALGLPAETVAVAETGTIGVPLPIDSICAGVAGLVDSLSPRGGASFTEAIMTTDAGPKACTVELDGVTLSAQAKGAGMIEPSMATMLCFVQTDAVIDDPKAALRRAVDGSFERITVDGQMSTNDMVLLQATGASGRPLPDGLLEAVLGQLAIEIVADGEGASRACRVEISGAREEAEAERVARAIANSPLVKTALYGRDPNWGRIAQAAGMALAGEQLGELGPDEIEASELASDAPEAEIVVALGRGEAGAHVFFSDLTQAYVELNAEYTT